MTPAPGASSALGLLVIFVLFIAVLIEQSAAHDPTAARYDNYRLYEITPKSDEHIQILQQFEEKSDSYKFLRRPVRPNVSINVIVPPHKFAEFTQIVGEWPHRIIVTNVQALIDDESLTVHRSAALNWNAYHSLQSIYDWIDAMAKEYPKYATVIAVGTTYEGRPIRGLRISFAPDAGNPGVFIEGGIHAREWIAPAVVTYLANALLTADDRNETVQSMAHRYDWYLVPSANPDGYVYSHERDRFWRKTRQPFGSVCYGADPNRNWDFHWSEQGTSSVACSDSYGGPAPFSEIETRSYAEYLRNMGGKLHAFIAFHSYSQLILFPYGHTGAEAPNHKDLQEIGDEAALELRKRYGTRYEVGPIYHTIYPASGSSADYVYGKLNVSIAFTYELRPAQGRAGFELPVDQIIPTCEETLDSLVVLLAASEKRGYFSAKVIPSEVDTT